MLYDSFSYKEELASELQTVTRRLENARGEDEEAAGLRLERFVFWTAFITRKMSEAQKLSDELESTDFQVSRYPRIDPKRLQDFMNWHRVEQFYDLNTFEDKRVSLLWICDQLTHSFVFFPELDEDSASPIAIFFNSDRSRTDSLFRIEWQEFVRLVKLVASDDVVSMSYDRRSSLLKKSRRNQGN